MIDPFLGSVAVMNLTYMRITFEEQEKKEGRISVLPITYRDLS